MRFAVLAPHRQWESQQPLRFILLQFQAHRIAVRVIVKAEISNNKT